MSELKVGVHRANTEERRARRNMFISTILSNVVVLPIDSKIADIHTGIVATLTPIATTIGPRNNWTAAAVLKYDYELLTPNLAEHRRVPNLSVIERPNSS